MTAPGSRKQPLRPTGRQAEAAANDVEIAAAAFDVLTADPRASMADIADRAGVGVASLYRRYPTRQALVHQLCLDAMRAIGTGASTCARQLSNLDADPRAAFEAFLSSALAAGAGAMRSLAGTFDADAELARAAQQMNASMQEAVTIAQRRGAVRSDVVAADITQLFEMLRAVHVGDRVRSDELRERYLALFSSALTPSAVTSELPFGPPSWSEVSDTWNRVGATGRPDRSLAEADATPRQ